MPALEITDLVHKAVLWNRIGSDVDGMPKVSATPVEIRCRWVGKQSQVLDAQGNTISVDATAVIAQDIEIGSCMWFGKLTGLPATLNLMTVVSFDSTDDIKGRSTRSTVGLKRAKNSLPATG